MDIRGTPKAYTVECTTGDGAGSQVINDASALQFDSITYVYHYHILSHNITQESGCGVTGADGNLNKL